jgi:hypothetical protein
MTDKNKTPNKLPNDDDAFQKNWEKLVKACANKDSWLENEHKRERRANRLGARRED